MSDSDVRWRQRFQSFQNAFGQLAEAAALAETRSLSKLEQQGLIQAFEFTHELAWNTLKDFLEFSGVQNLYGSRDATREAFATGLIENGEVWMEMIKSRNESMHTYEEETANRIARAILTDYVVQYDAMRGRFLELEREQT